MKKHNDQNESVKFRYICYNGIIVFRKNVAKSERLYGV